jgi:hypothetical protein
VGVRVNIADTCRRAWRALGVLALLFAAACDDTSTSSYTQCYQNHVGDTVYERCCTTNCTYDDSCYYYYGGDCNASCTKTCYDNSATPVSTAIYVTPSARPPTRTPTPTPTPALGARIDIGSTVARPGDDAGVTVALVTSGAGVAATGNDLSFDPNVLSFDTGGCRINPAIGKSLVASVVHDDGSTKTLRLFVSSNGNASAIADGALYTCTFAVAPSALPGTYGVTNGMILAFAPDGTPLGNVTGGDGSVTVSLIVLPSPTPTPTG